MEFWKKEFNPITSSSLIVVASMYGTRVCGYHGYFYTEINRLIKLKMPFSDSQVIKRLQSYYNNDNCYKIEL